jgi:putative transposase
MLGVLSSLLKSRAALQLENVALRNQIRVLQRLAKKRMSLNNSDRLLWVGLSRVWTEWRSGLVIVKPDTVIAWHRKAFRLFWTWKVRQGRPGRPAVPQEIRVSAGLFDVAHSDVCSRGLSTGTARPPHR